jgi:hypothetical protein
VFDAGFEDPLRLNEWEKYKARMSPLPPEEQARLDALMEQARQPVVAGSASRHHYIPESFLREFADSDERLLVVTLDGERPRMSHIHDTAVVSHLYTTVDPVIGETVAVETLLGVLDGEAARILSEVRGLGSLPLSEPDRTTLALWVALLHVRGPHYRRVMEALGEQFLKMDLLPMKSPSAARERLRINLGREPTDAEVRDLVEAAATLDEIEVVQHQNDLVKMMLDTALAMVPHLIKRRISMIRFGKPGLVLSDRPVTLNQSEVDREAGLGVGIINATDIALPIDRRSALVFHSSPGLEDGFVAEMQEEGPLADMNQRTVSNAAREIYCHPEDEIRLGQLTLPSYDQPLMGITGHTSLALGVDGINAAPERRTFRRDARWPDPRAVDEGDLS